jgi:hypothetical protein
MAEPLGMKYRALHVITDPNTGARAYNPGDLVHESAVDGEDAWLTLGVDVEPREGVKVSRPHKNAPTAQWVEFAVGQGLDREAAEGLSRKELIKRYGEDAKAEGQAAEGVESPGGEDAANVAERAAAETGSDEDGAPQGTAGAEA